MKYNKMAILGDGEGVLAFTAVGVDAFPTTSEDQARKTLKRLAKEYRIIFVTDDIAVKIDDLINEYLTTPYPIILSVPSKEGGNGYGMEGLKRAMEKALGVDILFNKKDN